MAYVIKYKIPFGFKIFYFFDKVYWLLMCRLNEYQTKSNFILVFKSEIL